MISGLLVRNFTSSFKFLFTVFKQNINKDNISRNNKNDAVIKDKHSSNLNKKKDNNICDFFVMIFLDKFSCVFISLILFIVDSFIVIYFYISCKISISSKIVEKFHYRIQQTPHETISSITYILIVTS